MNRNIELTIGETVIEAVTMDDANGVTQPLVNRLAPTPTASLPAATTVPAGTMVYDSTTDKYKFSNGTAWEVITSA